MIHNLAIIYSVAFMGFTIFSSRLKITKKQIVILWGFFTLSLSVMAYNMDPPLDWDIIRHEPYFNQIRNSNISLFNFLFNNIWHIGGSEYRDLFIFNILRYFAVHISENNYLLPAICVFLDLSILGYIAIDWSTENSKDYKLNLLTLLVTFTFLPYLHMASGMRNALCACIMGLAVYLYLYKGTKVWMFIILTFIALTIHPAAIITVPFVFVAKLNMGLKGFILVFSIPALINSAIPYLINSQISFLSRLGRKYIIYTSEARAELGASKSLVYGFLFLIAIFLISYFCKHLNLINDNKKNLYNFLAVYMFYICGNLGSYEMIRRPAYVLGSLSPILVTFFSRSKLIVNKKTISPQNGFINLGLTTICFTMCCYANYNSFILYGTHF